MSRFAEALPAIIPLSMGLAALTWGLLADRRSAARRRGTLAQLCDLSRPLPYEQDYDIGGGCGQ